MWRNFRNVGSAMQAIGNVVAPPIDEEGDEESYTDDDEEEEEEEVELEEADDINSEEHDEQWINDNNHKHQLQDGKPQSSPLQSGFGFVGMIARALDRSHDEEDDDEEGSYDEDEDEYDDDREEVVELFPDEALHNGTVQQQDQIIMNGNTAENVDADPDVKDNNDDLISTAFQQGASTPPMQQEDDGWDDIHETWANNNNDEDDGATPLKDTIERSGTKQERRRSIQRETGSVSPLTNTKKSLQSSPIAATDTLLGTSDMVKNLQAKLPDLLVEPEQSAGVKTEEKDAASSGAPVQSQEGEAPKTSGKDANGEASAAECPLIGETSVSDPPNTFPETETPGDELEFVSTDSPTGSPTNSKQSEAASAKKVQKETGEKARPLFQKSSSDARFLAELPRPEATQDPVNRWGVEKSTAASPPRDTKAPKSPTQIPQPEGNPGEQSNSKQSVGSYFDDSSLSSVSDHVRSTSRKGSSQHGTKFADKVQSSASNPTLSTTGNSSTPKEDKSRKSLKDDRFRAEPVRLTARDLPEKDLRFHSTKSHTAPPPEPQRQMSVRQCSVDSSENKAEFKFATTKSQKTPPIEPQRQSSVRQWTVGSFGKGDEAKEIGALGFGAFGAPRNPRRSYSGEQYPSILESEPKTQSEPNSDIIDGSSPVGASSRSEESCPEEHVHEADSALQVASGQKLTGVGSVDKDRTDSINGFVPNPSGKEESAKDVNLRLEKRLKEALEGRARLEERLREEQAARQAQADAFKEKESKLLELAAQDQDHIVSEIKEEMERRVSEISSLLEDQQREHENDRAEWQEILKETEDQLQALKDGDRDDFSNNLTSLLEDQQRQHEEERAEWQEELANLEEQLESAQKEKGEALLKVSPSARNEEQKQHRIEEAEWQELLRQANQRAEMAEREKEEALSKLGNSQTTNQQWNDRAVRMAEDKLAQSLAVLDEREEQINQLKRMVKEMSDEMNEHHEGVQEVEEEADELRHQNEVLQHRLDTAQAECSELHEELSRLQSDTDKMASLKMELRLLKEDRERERMKSQSVAESAESSGAQLATERDTALAEVSMLRQQLAAAQADTEIAQQDAARAQRASQNLQMALESMQGEREAELQLLEEQRKSYEESTVAAHAAALEATHEANEARIREVQAEANAAVVEAKAEIEKLKEKLESYRVENVQMRRSLDEAIGRLQHNQEDVIDRTLMKNILIDWLTKHGNKEKRQILELMASVLHFTDEDKARVHVGGEDFSFGKVVATVAAPPPPSKADVEHLEGSNVREKWVNFLLAETE